MSRSAIRSVVEWKAVGMAERLCRVSFGYPSHPAPNLGIVLAAWDPIAATTSVNLILERFEGVKGVNWSMVVVANNGSVAPALPRSNGKYEVVVGSNQEAEFSAYEEGRQALMVGSGPPDVWLIVNDRLPVYGAECLRAVTPEVLRFAGSVAIAAGTIDFLPHYYLLHDRPFRCYIRSNYVVLSNDALSRIGSLCAVRAAQYEVDLPLSFPGPDWSLPDWVSPELSGFVRSFLTQPTGWSRAEPFSAASWPRIRFKTLSIVNEFLLSSRLIGADVPLVPWRLARAMSHLDPTTPFSQELLQQYRVNPGFGGALENSSRGRLQLAAAVVTARAGATKTGEAFLAAAAKVGASEANKPWQESWA
jgi:hypothetical protein